MNFYSLRNKYVTSKNNENIALWEKETPKDIRAGAIRDMTKAFKTAITNLKRGNISKFKLGFRSKKKESSIDIPKSAIKLTSGKVFIYKSYIGEGIKLCKDKSLLKMKIEYDCRLKNENGNWYLIVPIKSKVEVDIPPSQACALDPGVRKFQTVYSEDMTMKIEVRKECLRKLQNRLDHFQSLRSRKIIKKSHYNRRKNKIYRRLNNLIDDLHFQTISFLTNTFNTIFLPSFESQELVRKNKIKVCRRDLLTLKHYLFKQRLLDKSKLKKYCSTYICTEEYTSKTCSRCGILSSIKDQEIFNCKECHLQIDRDINGARNIFIKVIKETG